MGKRRAAITGVHGYVPDFVLTNEMLENMVETSDEWITTRTGIKERRILKGEGKATSDLAVEAVNGLIDKTGIDKEDIDLLICATVTGDFIFPDTANVILDKCGINRAYGFDINAACSGFLYALTAGSQFIESGTYKKVVVVGADKMSAIVDYEDRKTCVLFGDGAGAVLLEPNTDGNGRIDSILRSDGSARSLLYMKAGGSLNPPSARTVENREHYITQDGAPVFKAAVKGMSSSIREVLAQNSLTQEDISWVVPHQANMRIINSVADMLDFPKEKVMINIHKYGNTTAATIPLCLWEYEDQIKKGDHIVLTAFGGGFTWGATLLKWAY